MSFRIEYHDAFALCGFGAQMTLREYGYNNNRARLLADLQAAGHLETLDALGGDAFWAAWFCGDSPDEIYWVICRSVAATQVPPAGAVVREVAAHNYLVFEHEPGDDREVAWTADYYKAGTIGVKLNYNREAWMEYYPDGYDGRYELWMSLASDH
ncbi:MAG: GyrI-like domain-containing protein [Propionibacteriaceae bacterium]|jgi:predicted transcriptional regulator YdeE|nr:GyrI-like domain-containing protein [Propionibacteriaceae bacterium]